MSNGSDDGSDTYLADQPDVSLWTTNAGYKAARFGLDWTGWLLAKYGHRHWCLTLDADELLIYPHWRERGLHDLTHHLQGAGRDSFGALMIDLYPEGRLAEAELAEGSDPLAHLTHFDPGPYRQTDQPHLQTNLFQGGVRDRLYFAQKPRRAPTMNKVPLVRWHWRYAYMNSTHSVLPTRLNAVFDLPGSGCLSGALLHTKFLPHIVERSAEEKRRQQHFANSAAHDAYYDALIADPEFHDPNVSVRFTGWRQLAEMGLIGQGDWT